MWTYTCFDQFSLCMGLICVVCVCVCVRAVGVSVVLSAPCRSLTHAHTQTHTPHISVSDKCRYENIFDITNPSNPEITFPKEIDTCGVCVCVCVCVWATMRMSVCVCVSVCDILLQPLSVVPCGFGAPMNLKCIETLDQYIAQCLVNIITITQTLTHTHTHLSVWTSK